MTYLKCTAPGCAAAAHVTGINPSYCAQHTLAHYVAGGLDVTWWTEQMEQDRTAWRAAQSVVDVRIDLIMAKLREIIAARTSSGSSSAADSLWFIDMTIAALRVINIDPPKATVTLSEALFETYFFGLAAMVAAGERHPGGFAWVRRGLRLSVDSAAMDSRLAYDDLSGERVVVVYPPIDGLR
jgi:hypothetical protein